MIVLLGDSLSVGTFPSLHAGVKDSRLFAKVGAPISWMVDQVSAIAALSPRPSAVLVMAGTNDLVGAPPEMVIGRLVQLVRRLEARDLDVIVSTLPPQKTKNAAAVEIYNEAILDRNVGGAAVDVGGVVSLSEISGDGVHPTASGYQKMGLAWEGVVAGDGRLNEPPSLLMAGTMAAAVGGLLWWSLRRAGARF